jgi:hypothetical protein
MGKCQRAPDAERHRTVTLAAAVTTFPLVTPSIDHGEITVKEKRSKRELF